MGQHGIEQCGTKTMELYRVIYTSRPFGYDQAMLNGILVNARHSNARDNVTGALICRRDVFIQLLEGPEDKVKQTVARIARDDRHTEMALHVQSRIPDRLFGAWAMLHDPAATWIWSAEAVSDGAIERATPQELEGFFEKLLARQDAV